MADASLDRVEHRTHVTRVEVIDEDGRVYSRWDLSSVELHTQDEGRTLKVFLNRRTGP